MLDRLGVFFVVVFFVDSWVACVEFILSGFLV